MIGFEHALWLKIVTGTPAGQAAREVMAAFEAAERERAAIYCDLARTQRRDQRTLYVMLSALVGLWALVMVGIAYLADS